uniref:Glucosylceramidase n=1 Tax=Acrobeloides nanus TaxID=290746 RepID=A0A914DEK2_9BILA
MIGSTSGTFGSAFAFDSDGLDPDAAKYVDGVAVHWYADGNGSGNESPATLDTTHQNHPNTFLMYTEACTGCCGMQPAGPSYGDWSRGDRYAHDIIEDLNHWVVGWTDWNLCLDIQGGPNWVNNYVDAAIIVNATVDEFYKNP